MDIVDLTEILTSSLTSLQLHQNHTHQTPNSPSSFTLFPLLPAELRLKILSHALPVYNVLRLNARILIADASFGLYLTFSLASPRILAAPFTIRPVNRSLSFKATRELNLLLVNKEARCYYTSQFPLTLPSGLHGAGQIRFSPYETVFMQNFDNLMIQREFSRALDGNYRLQDCWGVIERLAVPVSCFVSRGRGPLGNPDPMFARVILKFRGLRVLGAMMWEGFTEEVGSEETRKGVRKGMEHHLTKLRGTLENAMQVSEGNYVIPEIMLLWEK